MNKIRGEKRYNERFIKEKPVNFKNISAKIKIIKANPKTTYFFK